MEDDFEYLSFQTVCDMIHGSGGVAVLAHPEKIKKKNTALYMALINSNAIDGVEIFHPSNGVDTRLELMELAKKRNLIYTGGTDYHGTNMKQRNLVGDVDVPKQCYDFLKQFQFE